MIFYIIGVSLLLIALVVFLIAPRNLIDHYISIAGFLFLFWAIVNDEHFADYYPLKQLFHMSEKIADYIAPLLLLIFGVCMISYALSLYQKEKSKIQLIIGLTLSVLLIGIGAFHYWLVFVVVRDDYQDWVRIPDFVMAYYVILYINYLFISARLSFLEPQESEDYVIVLGASLRPDGSPTLVLQRRLNQTVSYLRRHVFMYGKLPQIIVSGGYTLPDRDISEAEAMANDLISQGIPAENIIIEDKAMNTHENFYFSRIIMQTREAHFQTMKIVFITSSYHLYRGQLYANLEQMYRMHSIGAPSTLKEWTFDSFREYIAILFMHRKIHFMVSVVLLALGIINYVHF